LYFHRVKNSFDDQYFMKQALAEAQQAFEKDEVPVGAVVVVEQRIIARAHNLTEQLNDVTAHAEMQAITAAAHFLNGKYLKECTLYVTLEPCVMCMGALYWSQLKRLVFAAADPKRGFQQAGVAAHPKTTIASGVMAADAEALLQQFFKRKR
jgi:tRNA(adenine34) deaminase